MSDKDHAPSRRSSFGPKVRLLCIGSALAAMGSTAAASEESGIEASTNLGRVAGKLLRHDTRALVIGDSTFAEANDTIGFWSAALHQWRPVHWRGFGYDNPSIQNGYNGFCGYNRLNSAGSGVWSAIYPGDVTHPNTGEFALDFVAGRYNHELGGGTITDLFGIGLNREALAVDNPHGPICTDANEISGLGRPGTTIRCETDLYHLMADDWLGEFTGYVVNFDGSNTMHDLSRSTVDAEDLGQSDQYVRSTIGASVEAGDAATGSSHVMLRVSGPDGFNTPLPEGRSKFVRGATRIEREDVPSGLFMQSIARGGWTINFHAQDPTTRGDAWWPVLNRGTGNFYRGYSDAALDKIVRANRIDTFIVSLGINDAMQRRTANQMVGDFDVLLDRIESSYQRVWNTTEQPYILILAPWHLRGDRFDPAIAAAMEGFETRLRDRCDGRIGLLSIEELHQRRFGDLNDASPATTDLVHPNKFGANIIMRDAWDQIVQHAAPAGDLDLDGDVDAADFGRLLQAWGQPGGPADLNGDGLVNPADLGLLFIEWGRWLP